MDTSKIVGEKIKSLRESQSISMEELAQRSGLAIEQIERIENNIDLPSLAPLIKIARVLGVRLGTFLDDQDENGPVVCRMFYHIFKYLGEYYDIPGSGMFQYISFRAAAAIILALLIVIIFGRKIIDFLRRKQIGAPSSHWRRPSG